MYLGVLICLKVWMNVFICTYVLVYVHVYVCMYICMVCMHACSLNIIRLNNVGIWLHIRLSWITPLAWLSMINAKKPTSIEQVRRSSIHKLLMYVCMYVCIYVFIYCHGRNIIFRSCVYMYACTYEWIHVCNVACMHVYICMHTLLTTIV